MICLSLGTLIVSRIFELHELKGREMRITTEKKRNLKTGFCFQFISADLDLYWIVADPQSGFELIDRIAFVGIKLLLLFLYF
jgi:hypothetical protein